LNNLTSLEGGPSHVGGRFDCDNNELASLLFAPKEPDRYYKNPCEEIYEELGFTVKGHVKALELLQETDPDYDLIGTLERLRLVNPSLAEELTILYGFKGEGLKKAIQSYDKMLDEFY